MPPHVLARAPDVITTTVFAGDSPPTSTPLPSQGTPPLPVGAIVGGLLGGVVLALAAVGGWIWWGKSIEKQSRKKKPRLRSAMKHRGGGSSASASKNSLPASRTPPTKNPMASVSQKSVTFAPPPSPRTSDSEESRASPQTPSADLEPEPRGDEKEEKGKEKEKEQEKRVAPPRSALRPPPSKRGYAYAPSRPSPLAHASHAQPPHPPPVTHPPPALRQLANLSVHVDRTSGVSAPSVYSQEGTASEGGSDVGIGGHAVHPHREGAAGFGRSR